MIKYIGIAGLARAGKNLFTDIMESVIRERLHLTTKSFALAYTLKKDCEQFIQDKLGVSVWSEKTDDKNMFRDMLVWYGKVKRQQTRGRYWINSLQEYMDKSDVDVKFITDIRYVTHERDELQWIKEELNGKLIHISKYSIVNDTIVYGVPPNKDEAENNPILNRQADVRFVWEDMSDMTYSAKLANIELRDRVYNECVKPIFNIS